jgi:hypothetical protein
MTTPLADTAPKPHLDEVFKAGFIKQCRAQGLDEETTTSLLYAHCLETALKEDPAFREGFERVIFQGNG